MNFEVLHKQLNLFKIWDGLDVMPNQTTVLDYFPNLAKAVKWMNSFELLYYSPNIAYEHKLPALITDMAIITDKNQVIASKMYLLDTPSKGIVEGIYLHINTDLISVPDFERQGQFNTSLMRNINGDGVNFLVATKDDLAKMLTNEQIIRTKLREIRPNNGKGLGLN